MTEAQMMNIEWRYSKAIFDPNQWHEITESRVDWLWKTPFSSNLHSLNDAESTLEIKGLRPQVWQLLPVDGVPGRYVMRSNFTGPSMQIATCFKSNEIDDSKTGICLRDSTGEDNQKWDIDFVETTGSTYIFRNVANSSDFVLDCHPGNPIFMNKNFDPTNNPAQHWILRPDGEINDDAFSTTYTSLPAGATNKPLPTDTSIVTQTPRGTTRGPASSSATGTTGTDSEDSSSGNSTSSSSLSAGAAAGVGIGAALGVLLIVAAVFAFLRRRNRPPGTPFFGGPTPRIGKAQEMEGSPGPNGGAVAAWNAKTPDSDDRQQQQYPHQYPQQHQLQHQYSQHTQQHQYGQTPPLHTGTSQSPSSPDHASYAAHGTAPMNRTGTWSTSGGKNAGTIDMMSPLGYGSQHSGTPQHQHQRQEVHEAMGSGVASQELDSTPL